MKSDRIHVVPHEEQWAVKREHASRASVVTSTKTEAYSIAKGYASKNNGEVILHNKTGKISNPNSFGNDPCPPKDKKN